MIVYIDGKACYSEQQVKAAIPKGTETVWPEDDYGYTLKHFLEILETGGNDDEYIHGRYTTYAKGETKPPTWKHQSKGVLGKTIGENWTKQ